MQCGDHYEYNNCVMITILTDKIELYIYQLSHEPLRSAWYSHGIEQLIYSTYLQSELCDDRTFRHTVLVMGSNNRSRVLL